jgi:hypothetical protein
MMVRFKPASATKARVLRHCFDLLTATCHL